MLGQNARPEVDRGNEETHAYTHTHTHTHMQAAGPATAVEAGS
jgi:hypothetical protein